MQENGLSLTEKGLCIMSDDLRIVYERDIHSYLILFGPNEMGRIDEYHLGTKFDCIELIKALCNYANTLED